MVSLSAALSMAMLMPMHALADVISGPGRLNGLSPLGIGGFIASLAAATGVLLKLLSKTKPKKK
jgi:hypothetical protein